MYFKINNTFLTKRTKEDLLWLFRDFGLTKAMPKTQMVRQILKASTHIKNIGPCDSWIIVCPYCRTQLFVASSKKEPMNPRFCAGCGKASPLHAFEANLGKTSQLVILSSKMNRKEEKDTKNVLLEQALVTVITGLEVLMREVYSLIYDHRHVVIGRSIFYDIYSRTRNEFLNLGSASKWLRKVSDLNLKKEISEGDYKFLSRAFSARHIVVHNCSVKDKDFLSQTGEPDTELNKPLKLNVKYLRKLISVSRKLARVVVQELHSVLLQYQHERLDTIRTLQRTRKQKKSRTTA
jgi:uncharacterized protein YbaR (Trm112 family)